MSSTNDTQLIEDCIAFLTPNADIAGIGVRISVYFQTFLCIVLLFFRHADDLFKGSFRNAVLTLYAVAFALVLCPSSQPHISVQIYVVLHGFISLLLLSSYALLCFHPKLRSKVHYITLLGAVPLGVYVFVKTIQGIQDTKCAQFEITHITDHRGIRVFVALWAGAIGSYALTIPLMTLLWFPNACSWFQHGLGKGFVALVWFASWVVSLVACEFAANNFAYKGPTDQTATRLTSNEFAFGQVIAVVMLFSQLWDVAVYPFHESDEDQGGKRIVYWYQTRLRPAYRSFLALFGHKQREEDAEEGKGSFSGNAEKSSDVPEPVVTAVDDIEGGKS